MKIRTIAQWITFSPLNQLLGCTRKYMLPLCLIFVDYEKTFDSIELYAVPRALADEKIERSYVEVVREANTGCSADITVSANPVRMLIERIVKSCW